MGLFWEEKGGGGSYVHTHYVNCSVIDISIVHWLNNLKFFSLLKFNHCTLLILNVGWERAKVLFHIVTSYVNG